MPDPVSLSGDSVHVISYELGRVDWTGHALQVSSIPSDFCNLSFPLLQASWNSEGRDVIGTSNLDSPSA